jgi:MinD-like ATPase involved in chromosome partitioning or flagellar assembly
MAMVNVAADLIAQGKSVLLVDFDLEAPGLDTFCKRLSPGTSKGVVDFIDSYISTGQVPDVSDYVYVSTAKESTRGRLLVMPAGAQDRDQDRDYDTRFKSIDWNYLYRHQDGFLLFEDLKAQWEHVLDVDYVLVDSRTGHTDVGGICTRQLPDAVVVFFFPNEQNRRGLATIVELIRSEEYGPLQKKIKLHFVMSNVPDLDDEDEILAANVEKIRATLNYDELAATIHHYNSLLLLDQAVFTLERPRSRLAHEYKALAKRIRRSNIEDREGALDFLEEVAMRRPRSRAADFEEHVQQIIDVHSDDGEVLRQVARLRKRQRKWQDALALLNQAISKGLVDSDSLLARSELRVTAGDKNGAVSDLKQALALPEAPYFDIEAAARLLIELGGEPELLLQSPAVASLEGPELAALSYELQTSTQNLPIAEELLKRKLRSQTASPELVQNQLALCLISQGKFADAKSLILSTTGDFNKLDLSDTFNYAMAEWGNSQRLPTEIFAAAIALHLKSPSSKGPNYHQCIAISFWAIGDLERAFEQSKSAYELMGGTHGASFSCWSYLRVDVPRFYRDIAAMDRMFNGQPVIPEFMTRAGITWSAPLTGLQHSREASD